MRKKSSKIDELANKIVILQRSMGKPMQCEKEIDRIYKSLTIGEVEELEEKLRDYDNMIIENTYIRKRDGGI